MLQGDTKRRVEHTENATTSEKRPRPRRFSQRPLRLDTTSRSFPGVAQLEKNWHRGHGTSQPRGTTFDPKRSYRSNQRARDSAAGTKAHGRLAPSCGNGRWKQCRTNTFDSKASPTPSRAFAVDRRLVNGIVQQEEDVAPTVRETPSRNN